MFADRHEAGRLLAKRLGDYSSRGVLVLAIPRGGVVVGFEIAQSLGVGLFVIIAKKIGALENPEFGIAAVCEDKSDSEIARRQQLYRGGKSLPRLRNQTVILVDDGIATGVTVEAAIKAVKRHQPKKLILAVPVIPADMVSFFKEKVDELIYILSPEYLGAVGNFYTDFSQVSDEEVLELLKKSRESLSA